MHAERCVVCGGSGKIPFYNGTGVDARVCHACKTTGWIVVPDAGDAQRAQVAQLVLDHVAAGVAAPTQPMPPRPDAAPATRVLMGRALVERLLHEGRLEYEKQGDDMIVTGIGWGNFFIAGTKESP